MMHEYVLYELSPLIKINTTVNENGNNYTFNSVNVPVSHPFSCRKSI